MILLEKRLPNEVSLTVETLLPYREQLPGIAIEATFN